jgi:hypothetical protein
MAEAAVGILAITSFLPVLLIGLAFAYVSLRIRDARADPPDPELGIKSGYYFFLTASIFLALTGLTISVIDLVDEALGDKPVPGAQAQGPQFNPQGRFGPQPMPVQRNDPFESVSQRVAWPLVISGVLFSLFSVLLIRAGTNDARFPSVRRTFVGMRMAVSGINVMFGVTFLILLLFQKDLPNMRPYAAAIGLIAVWVPTTLIHIFLMKQYGKLPYFVPPKTKKPRRRDDDELDDDDGDDEDAPPEPRRRGRREQREERDEED